MFKKWPILTFGGLGSVAAISASSSITLSENVKSLEIYFYDKNNIEKRIKFSIDSPSSKSYWEVYDSNAFKNFSSISSDKEMYEQLFNVGHKYVEAQHKINLISHSKDKEIDASKSLCCPKNQNDCKCEQNKCFMCICCYSDDKQCCCKEGATCKLDELKKVQKTFSYLLSNVYSGHNNIYLSPIQAYIKFSDSSFSDLTSQAEEKSFIGALAYGFVDYWYKPVQYKQNIIASDKSSEYSTLTKDSEKNYFANIPQKIKFKKANVTDASSSESETSIDGLLKKMKTTSEIKNLITSSASSEVCCEDKIECLIRKNFVFLESSNLESIRNKVKDANVNCSS